MSLQQQVTWKGIIVITLTVLLMPLAGLGHTALSRATDGGHTEIITMLKEAGAKE